MKMNDIESTISFISAQQRAKEFGLRIETEGDSRQRFFNIYRIIDNEFLSTVNSLGDVNCFMAGWFNCKQFYEKEPPSDWFLRVCIEARDKEWWKAICNLEEVKANPQAIKEWLTNALGVDIEERNDSK